MGTVGFGLNLVYDIYIYIWVIYDGNSPYFEGCVVGVLSSNGHFVLF